MYAEAETARFNAIIKRVMYTEEESARWEKTRKKQEREWKQKKKEMRQTAKQVAATTDKESLLVLISDYVLWRFPEEYTLNIEQYLDMLTEEK